MILWRRYPLGDEVLMKSNIKGLLIRAERARKQLLSPLLAAQGVRPGQGQAGILNALLEENGLNQKELSNRCHMDTTTMSRNIDTLEQLGFLTREMNPANRRSVRINLTAEGSEKAAAIHEIFIRFEELIRKDISEEEMLIFQRTLLKICENIEERIPE